MVSATATARAFEGGPPDARGWTARGCRQRQSQMDGRRPAFAGAQNPAYRPARPPPVPLACGAVMIMRSQPTSGHRQRGTECFVKRVTSPAAGLRHQMTVQVNRGCNRLVAGGRGKSSRHAIEPLTHGACVDVGHNLGEPIRKPTVVMPASLARYPIQPLVAEIVRCCILSVCPAAFTCRSDGRCRNARWWSAAGPGTQAERRPR